MSTEQVELLDNLEKLGVPFSKIETELSMPKNYLSRFKNPVNVLPKKWVVPLQEYFKKYAMNGFEATEKAAAEVPKTKLVVEEEGLKEKKVETIVSEVNEKINKDFGAGTIMRWGDKPDPELKVISTGSLSLDLALGIGGLPRGRMVEIFGLESSGKSTISLQVIANAQKQGLKCLLIDAENSFDPEYAEQLGVKVDEMEYCQPSYGEEGFEVADRKILEGDIGVCVIDSVAAMIPKAELEGAMGDSKLGLHARLMSQVCRKMVGTIAKTNTLCLFINQVRNKIGVVYGSPEVTTGGLALQFYSSVRLSVTRSVTKENSVMNGNVTEGNKTTVKVVKNKCAPPFRSAVFNIIYGKGVDTFGEVVDLAVHFGIVKKSGSWFSYKEDKLGQGIDGVISLLSDNEELFKEVKEKVIAAISNK